MRIIRYLVACASALLIVEAVAAKDTVVTVGSDSGPWSVEANKALMPFGSGDEKPPIIVKFDFAAGKVAIFATGTTGTAKKPDIGPSGIDGKNVDDTLSRKRRYPSFYVPKILYPINEHALIAAFVDDKGVVVGRPFGVGDGVRVSLPDGASGVALGFNDAEFKGNTGALQVTVETPN